MWNESLLTELSKGAKAERPGSLARLAAVRALTESQFWTPLWVARFIWDLIDTNTQADVRYSVMDNSFGSGRLCSYANPDTFLIRGIDTDGAMIETSGELLKRAGFRFDLVSASMADIQSIPATSIAVINPPFSIRLQSPNLKAYEGVTSYGLFGPNTSAVSHEYALVQALACSDCVFALLPKQLADKVKSGELPLKNHYLVACFRLPASTFRAEGVNSVDTELLVIQRQPLDAVLRMSINETTTAPKLSLTFRGRQELYDTHGGSVEIKTVGVEASTPKITLPVTGDKRVRLYQKRSKIGMRFYCGLMQALAMNSVQGQVLQSSVDHRYPSHVKWEGHGKLNINAHLMHQDPLQSITDTLITQLNTVGAQVSMDHQLIRFIARRAKQEALALTPLGKSVKRAGGTSTVEVNKTTLLDPFNFASPVMTRGEILSITQDGAKKSDYAVVINGELHDVDLATLKSIGTVTLAKEVEWSEVHAGRIAAFPQRANQLFSRAQALNIPQYLTWDFQLNDVVELCMSHTGGGLCADMGLGKSRMAIALCSMGGKYNLLVVKSRLVAEMLRECNKIGMDTVKVISSQEDCNHLEKVNIVSYETLRKPVRHRGKVVTLASFFAHKFHSVVLDEASLMGHSSSQRACAVRQLQAKKYFALDGVMIDNYPRNLLPIATLVAGASVPSQPYDTGGKGEYLEAYQVRNSKFTRRGVDAFADDFVTTVWAVNEFRDNLEQGAKREVPRIADVVKFREWADCFIKRRVRTEPAVAKHIKIREAVIHQPELVEWDAGHWHHYHIVATEFANWFSNYVARDSGTTKGTNLVRVLAEIEAVNKAANAPHVHSDAKSSWKKTYGPLTSKQRWTISKAKSIVAKGRRPIVFAQSPYVLQRLSQHLEAEGYKVLLFTGQQTIAARTKALDSQLRNAAEEDKIQIMLATYGACADGLNLPEVTDVVLYSGSWSYRTIQQAIARTLRPDQLSIVEVHSALLKGSIDEYQAQVMNWKRNAMAAGIDHADQNDESEGDFLHLSHIFHQFVQDLAPQPLHAA